MEDAITYHRGTMVPHGYTPHYYRPNIPENYLDKLRSVVATFRYRHKIAQLKEHGVDCSCYLYVPEVDPTTGDIYYGWEKHCHI